MKKTVCIILSVVCWVFIISGAVTVMGEEDYDGAFSVINDAQLEEFLAETESEYFDKNGIDVKDGGWVNKITVTNIFSELLEMLKDNALKPVRVLFSLLSVILITAAFTSGEGRIGINKTAAISGVAVASIIVLSDLWGLVGLVVGAVRDVCKLVMAFIPVFESSLLLSGRITTSAAGAGLLVIMSQGLSLAASDFALPVMGGYLGLATASSLLPFPFIRQFGATLKKASTVILSAVFSVFVGITGIQTTVNSAADNLTLKTSKFIVGTFVPIGGGALSEAANTVYSSMSLIKASVGAYAVVSIILICLPVLIMTVLFKLALSMSLAAADTFSQTEVSALLSAVNSFLSVLLSAILFFGGIFVFSIAVVLSLSGGG